jgi:FKBP-type peptidyl-prolyl cis-trans isomerase SlyD
MVFTAQGQNGPVQLTVAKVEGDDITVDPNHPLAGKTLNFSGSVIEVRDATQEELAHGHAHGPGGHHH